MKAKECLKILKVTRVTLSKYVRQNYIKAEKKLNGQYEYDANSVYEFLNKMRTRKNIIYNCFSNNINNNQRNSIIYKCRNYCTSNGMTINNIYYDDDKCDSFLNLFDDITDGNISNIITYKNSTLPRFMNDIVFRHMCEKYGVNVFIIY